MQIVEMDEEMTLSTSGRYVPPLVEAPSAKHLGLVVTIIIIVFITCLLLLDLTTLRRDIGQLFKNIRLQKRLWQAKKRLRDAKKQPKARQKGE